MSLAIFMSRLRKYLSLIPSPIPSLLPGCRYHHGRRWTDKFAHVVGVMHTNYLDYARREEGGQVKETLLR